jgi:uncharacterized membrane protein
MRADVLTATGAGHRDESQAVYGATQKFAGPIQNRRFLMLIALALLLLVLAIVGGIAIHPLLFLIAVLAVVAFFATRR